MVNRERPNKTNSSYWAFFLQLETPKRCVQADCYILYQMNLMKDIVLVSICWSYPNLRMSLT